MNTNQKIEYGRTKIKNRQQLSMTEVFEIIDSAREKSKDSNTSINDLLFYAVGNAYLLGYAKGIRTK